MGFSYIGWLYKGSLIYFVFEVRFVLLGVVGGGFWGEMEERGNWVWLVVVVVVFL